MDINFIAVFCIECRIKYNLTSKRRWGYVRKSYTYSSKSS
ncbi:protein of unknown function [Clostridium beijerinckii]|nr:protein of unknown function [Clostridium beijerinckii]